MEDKPSLDPAPPPEEVFWSSALSRCRRVGIAIGGGIVLLIGIAMIFLPGPALLVIPAGLGILAIEFEWSRRWLHTMKSRLRRRTKKPRINDPQ